MRTHRLLLALLLVGTTLLLALALLRLLSPPSSALAQPVPRGDCEIAWIHAATNSATWERFVAGVRHLADEWPNLVADTSQAFPEQANRVPEVTLSFAEGKHYLRVRWYKMTSEMGAAHWVQQLAARDPAPRAIIGGGSSDRARDLALALRKQPTWHGSPPLLLITTATADTVILEGIPASPTDPPPRQEVKLTDVYPERTFRFCFQNSQMAEAVVDFVWSQPDLRPFVDPSHLEALAPVFTLAWDDDPYSVDLADRFERVLRSPRRGPTSVEQIPILYSVGDYNEPNRREADVVARLTEFILRAPQQRRLLVLPTLVQPARRILRKLAVTTPAAIRNVVAVTGDSINFNNIYRDRHVAWNVQEIPVPLVFFCHQDPVDWRHLEQGKVDLSRLHESATDDVLLNSAMLRLILEALPRAPAPGGTEEFTHNLRRLTFFDPDGNRSGGHGEFVVCLRPQRKGEEVLAEATAEVWRRDGRQGDGMRWHLRRTVPIRYDTPRRNGGAADAGP